MPGRRYPRRSQSEAQSSHARSAFLGGLDGASSVPYPVGLQPTQGHAGTGDCHDTSFFNDEFPFTGFGHLLMLTWVPSPGSEHVYVVNPGTGSGRYQLEGIAWFRDPGQRLVTVLNGMNAITGDTIVVEYAYRA